MGYHYKLKGFPAVTIENDLIDFIARSGKLPRHDVDSSTEIYNSGIISSLVILELMAFIEKRFNVVISPEKLIEDNFRDIRTLSLFVTDLVQGPDPAFK